jgi:putative acetyltransferase
MIWKTIHLVKPLKNHRRTIILTIFFLILYQMITIRPIRSEEISSAKRVILTVAYGIFGWDGSLEDSIRYFEASGEYDDMNNVQTSYSESGGLFLAVLDDDRVIGCGAIRKLNASTAELKRIWLLEKYHGRGIGVQLANLLLGFARERGYLRVLLQTSHQQVRAIGFYKKLGFAEIPSYNDQKDAVSMEIDI